MFRSFLVFVILFFCASSSYACYSGLVVIPTSETVGAEQYSAELQIDGSLDKPTSETRLINTQFGIGNQFEVGLDFDLSKDADPFLLPNAKYVFMKSPINGFTGAVGVFTSGIDPMISPYITMCKETGFMRIHFGTMRMDSNYRFFVGGDKALNDKWTVMSDYTNGNENSSSLGINYQFKDNIGVLAGVQFPNSGNDTAYSLHFVICGSCKQARSK